MRNLKLLTLLFASLLMYSCGSDEPDTPDIPDVPEYPSNPTDPDTPDNPDKPNNPDKPGNTDVEYVSKLEVDGKTYDLYSDLGAYQDVGGYSYYIATATSSLDDIQEGYYATYIKVLNPFAMPMGKYTHPEEYLQYRLEFQWNKVNNYGASIEAFIMDDIVGGEIDILEVSLEKNIFRIGFKNATLSGKKMWISQGQEFESTDNATLKVNGVLYLPMSTLSYDEQN